MEKIFKLSKASSADDINCKDGELETTFNSLFPEGSLGTADIAPSISHSFEMENSYAVPQGSRFVAIHTLPDGTANAILQLADGRPAFRRLSNEAATSAIPSAPAISAVVKAVGVNNYLAILTAEDLYFALWEDNAYKWIGSVKAPEATYTTAASPLPPYCQTASEFPLLSVRVTINNDDEKTVTDWLAGNANNITSGTRSVVTEAISNALKDFMGAVENANFYIAPVQAAVCYRLPDDTLFGLSEAVYPIPATQLPQPTLAIKNVAFSNSTLFLTLQFSRRPFIVGFTCKTANTTAMDVVFADTPRSIPDFDVSALSSPVWLDSSTRGFTLATKTVNPDSFPPLPQVNADICGFGLPSDIFHISGRLIALTKTDRGATFILPASPKYPFLLHDASPKLPIEGISVYHLTHTLGATGTSDLTPPPLNAFCNDGIRQLGFRNGIYVETRMVSRDIAAGPRAFAPLSASTAFITKAGVKCISTSSVKTLKSGTDYLDLRSKDSYGKSQDLTHCRLAYFYDSDTLVLFNPEDDAMPQEFHYGWPRLYIHSGNYIGQAFLQTLSIKGPSLSNSAIGKEELITVTSRPIKLTTPFDIKKVSEVEALWPDGSPRAFKLYGALKPDRWYFLGLAKRGRMLLRGSGWKFFRIETLASPSLLPTFKLIFTLSSY